MISNLSDIMIPHFHEVHREIRDGGYLKYIFKGGRNSGKSSHIALEIVLDIVQEPITVLCVRRVGNTLLESCYEQIKEAIDILGLGDKFKYNLNPLKITYLPRGNEIIFRGADDPAKIKSIKKSRYPIARLWIEELAEFRTEADVSMIEKSILRATLPDNIRYKFYYSYNPPKRKMNWTNKLYETQFIASNTYVNHSTYLDNPYVSREFIEEAEITKRDKPLKYEWDFLGKPTGAGVVPFDNLTFREITDEEVRSFDNIKQGLDWGYSVDPAHFGRWHYDKTRRKLYAIAEIHEIKLSNRHLADMLKKRGFNDTLIVCDSAEPKSIDDLYFAGLNAIGAVKGPGSIEYGEKWLDELEEIIIDPQRTPETAREFENIDYQVDKDGNAKAKLEDKDNHSIDAVRYAMEEDMNKDTMKVKTLKGGL